MTVKKMLIALAVAPTIAAACGSGQEERFTASPSPAGPRRVNVIAIDFAFEDVPPTLEAGETTFVLENQGGVRHEMVFARLPGALTIVEAAFGRGDSGADRLPQVISLVDPGESGEVTLVLEPGRYGYVCFLTNDGYPSGEEGVNNQPHAFRGMLGEFIVV